MQILLAISTLCFFALVWAGVAIAHPIIIGRKGSHIYIGRKGGQVYIGRKGSQAPVPSQGDFAQHLFAAIEDGSLAYSNNGSGDLSDPSQPRRLRASLSAKATSSKRS
ncbi:MAG TPA: hypothetical protein VK608_00820 [Edaphobacter sp.]|nr:hypothetical protein [Edaphobacter sp.]